MRFDGEWLLCDDGVTRPVVRGEIRSANNNRRECELLVDTGADCTVLSAYLLATLGFAPKPNPLQLAGVGGFASTVVVETELRLTRDDGNQAAFQGQYAACMDHHALDMSVLGRDILHMFALIVDRRSDVVAIIGGRHHYSISCERR